MNKRAFLAAAAIFCASMFAAGQPARAGSKLAESNALERSAFRIPYLTLGDREDFSFATAFNFIGNAAPAYLPAFNPIDPQRGNFPASPRRASSPDKFVDLQPSPTYLGGEVGFLYGKSTGKFGGDYGRAYVIGELGNDKIRISVGASYEESNARIPRYVR